MNAFEFGYAVGSLEKRAADVPTIVPGANPVNFRTVGNALATVPGQGVRGAPVRDTVRQLLESGKRLGGHALNSAKNIGGAVGGVANTVAGDVVRGMPGFNSVANLAGTLGILGGYGAQPGNRVQAAGRGVGYGVGGGLGVGLGQGLGKSISRLLPSQYGAAAQGIGGLVGGGAGLAAARKMMGPAQTNEAPATAPAGK